MIALEALFQACKEKNFPFAAYQLPGENEYNYIIQLSEPKKISKQDDFSKSSGFIFVPFEEKHNCSAYLISPDLKGQEHELTDKQVDIVLHCTAAKEIPVIKVSNYVAPKRDYIQNVRKLQDKIREGVFDKAILSRIIIERQHSNESGIFLKMCQKYHLSFISMVFIPGVGCWIGASPEVLFQKKNHQVTLVSLAGTQSISNNNQTNVQWDEKDIVEQQIVTDYLKILMQQYNIKHIIQNGPHTVLAGVVNHIKTEFSFSENELDGKIVDFIYSLHPTPAVWGQPKTIKLDYIKELEGYERTYYSGFLGPILQNGEIHLYVNLRTMKVEEDGLNIFVGSGITKDSNPLKEWDETSMKAMTLQSIINLL